MAVACAPFDLFGETSGGSKSWRRRRKGKQECGRPQSIRPISTDTLDRHGEEFGVDANLVNNGIVS
jgi:hypothetical protein